LGHGRKTFYPLDADGGNGGEIGGDSVAPLLNPMPPTPPFPREREERAARSARHQAGAREAEGADDPLPAREARQQFLRRGEERPVERGGLRERRGARLDAAVGESHAQRQRAREHSMRAKLASEAFGFAAQDGTERMDVIGWRVETMLLDG